MRFRKTKLLCPDHRFPPWLTEDATRERQRNGSGYSGDQTSDGKKTVARAAILTSLAEISSVNAATIRARLIVIRPQDSQNLAVAGSRERPE
jgi:hypothetical protein